MPDTTATLTQASAKAADLVGDLTGKALDLGQDLAATAKDTVETVAPQVTEKARDLAKDAYSAVTPARSDRGPALKIAVLAGLAGLALAGAVVVRRRRTQAPPRTTAAR